MKKIIAFLLLAGTWTFCRPQTPVHPADSSMAEGASPVFVQDLSATVKDNKVGLRWQTNVAISESYFVIERSNNGTDFTAVGAIKNHAPGAYEFTDDGMPGGKMYYRIRTTAGQYYAYSGTVSAVLTGDLSCRFYPNPVDKALIIRSDWPVDVQITDKFGKPVLFNRLSAGLKVVDVSMLEPGIYVISLFQKELNRLVTDKLVKK